MISVEEDGAYYFDNFENRPLFRDQEGSERLSTSEIEELGKEVKKLVKKKWDHPARCTRISSDSDDRANYLLDRCVQISVPSPEFRDKMTHFWDGRRVAYFRRSVVSAVCLAASVVGLVVSSIYPAPWLAAVLVVTSIAFSGFLIFSLKEGRKASYQKSGWAIDPAKKILEARSRAYSPGGFVYIHEKMLGKNGMVKPFEIPSLHEEYLLYFCKRLINEGERCSSDQSKQEWVREFCKDNPFSDQYIQTAYEGEMPHKYLSRSFYHSSWIRYLKELHEQYEQVRNRFTYKSEKTVSMIEKQKSSCLYLAKLALEQGGDKYSGGDLEKQHQVRCAYEAFTNIVKRFYDSQIENERSKLRKCLSEIDLQETTKTVSHFDTLQKILYFEVAKRKNMAESESIFFSPPPIQDKKLIDEEFELPSSSKTESLLLFIDEMAKNDTSLDLDYDWYRNFLLSPDTECA